MHHEQECSIREEIDTENYEYTAVLYQIPRVLIREYEDSNVEVSSENFWGST